MNPSKMACCFKDEGRVCFPWQRGPILKMKGSLIQCRCFLLCFHFCLICSEFLVVSTQNAYARLREPVNIMSSPRIKVPSFQKKNVAHMGRSSSMDDPHTQSGSNHNGGAQGPS